MGIHYYVRTICTIASVKFLYKLHTFLFCTEYERDPEDNPADFFLDTIITNEVTLDMAKQEGRHPYITDLLH